MRLCGQAGRLSLGLRVGIGDGLVKGLDGAAQLHPVRLHDFFQLLTHFTHFAHRLLVNEVRAAPTGRVAAERRGREGGREQVGAKWGASGHKGEEKGSGRR